MLQILANDDPAGTVGKPSVVRSGLGSLLFHLAVLVALVALQFTTAVLPSRFVKVALLAPAPPPSPPPPSLAKASRSAVSRPARVFTPVLSAPAAIPEHALPMLTLSEAPQLDLALDAAGGIPGGVPGGIPGGVIGSAPVSLPPAPAIAVATPPAPHLVTAAPVEPPKAARIHVSSEIQAAMLLNMVPPVYPEMAKHARIQGDVHLSAIIDREGRVTELKVVSGNPLLIGAARNAVERWRYRPTTLHGETVEVIADIIVEFRLKPQS